MDKKIKFNKIKILKNIIAILISLSLISLFALSTNSFADDFSNIKNGVKPNNPNDSSIANASVEILGIIQIIFAIIAIISAIILGIKLVLGQADVKADVKNALIALVIGSILVFTPVSIAKFFMGLAPTQ